MFARIACALVFAIFASSAFAAENVTFTDAHAQTSVSKVGVAFFTATAKAEDAIISASSDACDAVEIHTSEMKGDVMRMRKLDKLALKADDAVKVQEGGAMHVMLIGLKKPLKAGDSVKVTFTLASGAKQVVAFPVRAKAGAAATAAPESHSHH